VKERSRRVKPKKVGGKELDPCNCKVDEAVGIRLTNCEGKDIVRENDCE
jgi:hypothetical protein